MSSLRQRLAAIEKQARQKITEAAREFEGMVCGSIPDERMRAAADGLTDLDDKAIAADVRDAMSESERKRFTQAARELATSGKDVRAMSDAELLLLVVFGKLN